MRTNELLKVYGIGRNRIEYLMRKERENMQMFIYERSNYYDFSERALEEFRIAYNKHYVLDSEIDKYTSLMEIAAQFVVSVPYLAKEFKKHGLDVKQWNKKPYIETTIFEANKNAINYKGYYDIKYGYYVNSEARKIKKNIDEIEIEAKRIKRQVGLINKMKNFDKFVLKKIDTKESLNKIGVKSDLIEKFSNEIHYFRS